MRFLIVLFLLFGSIIYASTDSLQINEFGLNNFVGVWYPKDKNANILKANVIVWFHGGMSSANCSKGYVAGDDFSNMFPELIVVSLSACKENHWVNENTMRFVDMALDSIAKKRKSKIETVSLVGVSDGALGVIYYSLYGNRKIKNRLLISSFGKLLGDAFYIASKPKMQSGKWTYLHGGNDNLYPYMQAKIWIEDFCKNVRVNCELKYDLKGEHDWKYWKLNHQEWIAHSIL